MNDDEGGVERIDAEGRWLSDTSGEFELSYVPVLANQGFTELHAWHKDEKGRAHPMPGNAFPSFPFRRVPISLCLTTLTPRVHGW